MKLSWRTAFPLYQIHFDFEVVLYSQFPWNIRHGIVCGSLHPKEFRSGSCTMAKHGHPQILNVIIVRNQHPRNVYSKKIKAHAVLCDSLQSINV